MLQNILEIQGVLFSFYSTVFKPLLSLGPYPSLVVFSIALAGVFSLIYWKFLNKEKVDEIKEELEDKQEKMKKARKNDKDEKASEHMQETMKLNQKLMKQNFRPMIGTMAFVILIFPWLGATFSPSVMLQETSPDFFMGEFNYAGEEVPVSVDNSTDQPEVKFGDQNTTVGERVIFRQMEWEVQRFGENGGFFSREGTSVKLSAEFIDLPFTFPYIGGALNWLGFYIILAMPLTFIFRRMLGVN